MKDIRIILGIVGVSLSVGVVFFLSRGGKTVGIPDVNKLSKEQTVQQQQFLTYMKQDPKQLDVAKKDAQKRAAEQQIVEDFAKNHNIVVTQAEIEESYKEEVVRSKKSESAYLSLLQQMYGVSKELHLKQVRYELLKQKVQDAVHTPLVVWLAQQNKEKGK